MARKEDKTNVMRILEQHGIPYQSHCYLQSGAIGGVEVAAALRENPAQVFKTLVTVGRSGGHFVFVIPVQEELDLKKAARAAGEKSIEMIRQKELLPLTGYVHGGCSPIGMKKTFPTFLDRQATQFSTIFFSAGKIGYQVEVAPEQLSDLLRYEIADLCVENFSEY